MPPIHTVIVAINLFFFCKTRDRNCLEGFIKCTNGPICSLKTHTQKPEFSNLASWGSTNILFEKLIEETSFLEHTKLSANVCKNSLLISTFGTFGRFLCQCKEKTKIIHSNLPLQMEN